MDKDTKVNEKSLTYGDIPFQARSFRFTIGNQQPRKVVLYGFTQLGSSFVSIENYKGDSENVLPFNISFECDSQGLENLVDEEVIGSLSYMKPEEASSDGLFPPTKAQIAGRIIVETEVFDLVRDMSTISDLETHLSLRVYGLQSATSDWTPHMLWDTQHNSTIKIIGYDLNWYTPRRDEESDKQGDTKSIEKEILSTLKGLDSRLKSSHSETLEHRKQVTDLLTSCVRKLHAIIERGTKRRFFG